MRQHPFQRHAPLALLMAAALTLLAACGGAPSSPASSSGTISSGLTNAPTAAVAARESGAGALPAATSAPESAALGTMPTAGELAADSGAAPPASADSGSEPGDGGSTTSAAPRPQGQEASLKAGEINDNEHFSDYLDYLKSYQGRDVRLADVSERYLIKVIDDNQQPVMNAQVTIYAEDRVVFMGRTYAGGQTIFLPQAIGVSPNDLSFRVVATYGNASGEVNVKRGGAAQIEIGLRGVQRDSTLRLDLLFLLDTTGSMSDELGRIQQTIDSIAQRIDAFSPHPEIRYGMVAYRDIGDEYVTRPINFSTDLGQFRAALDELSAQGGGDTPEAVDAAMQDAVVNTKWSDQSAVRLIFLVADAGPHIDAQQQFTYLDGAREAVARGVKVYPIAASNTDAQAEYVFRQLAQQTMGGFIFLTYQAGESSGAPGESTTLEAGEQPYTVERLDDLIVSIVEREMAAAVGAN